MKRSIIALCLLSIAVASCNNADTKKETPNATDTTTAAANTAVKKDAAPSVAMPDSATKMKNWMTYSTPGDMQKMLASWEGKWDGDVSMWMDPTKEPTKAKVTSVNKMILGGRYLTCTNTGMMMGMPFEGQSVLAYDNAKKEFINTWIDNMGTGITTMTGTWNDATKTLELKGRMVNPEMGDGTEFPMRETYQIIDDKTQIMTMYYTGPDGKEFKNMEIKSTRK